jgi:hypothetical protein
VKGQTTRRPRRRPAGPFVRLLWVAQRHWGNQGSVRLWHGWGAICYTQSSSFVRRPRRILRAPRTTASRSAAEMGAQQFSQLPVEREQACLQIIDAAEHTVAVAVEGGARKV